MTEPIADRLARAVSATSSRRRAVAVIAAVLLGRPGAASPTRARTRTAAEEAERVAAGLSCTRDEDCQADLLCKRNRPADPMGACKPNRQDCGALEEACTDDADCCGALTCQGEAGNRRCRLRCRDLTAACTADGQCCSGLCANETCACPPGKTACDGTCTDVTEDRLNCGGCGRPCGPNELCRSGGCVPFDAPCSQPCGQGERCFAGVCMRADVAARLCDFGFRSCDPKYGTLGRQCGFPLRPDAIPFINEGCYPFYDRVTITREAVLFDERVGARCRNARFEVKCRVCSYTIGPVTDDKLCAKRVFSEQELLERCTPGRWLGDAGYGCTSVTQCAATKGETLCRATWNGVEEIRCRTPGSCPGRSCEPWMKGDDCYCCLSGKCPCTFTV